MYPVQGLTRVNASQNLPGPGGLVERRWQLLIADCITTNECIGGKPHTSNFTNKTKRRTFLCLTVLKLIHFRLCECALFRMYRIGLHSLFSLTIVAFGMFAMLMFLTQDKVGSITFLLLVYLFTSSALIR